jgi:hypothetical protein
MVRRSFMPEDAFLVLLLLRWIFGFFVVVGGCDSGYRGSRGLDLIDRGKGPLSKTMLNTQTTGWNDGNLSFER